MTVSAISKGISILGNPAALTPLAVKDVITSLSLSNEATKAGGWIEGRDRAIDEFGTAILWLGGIPFFKKIIDYIVYPAAKLDPEVDVRVLCNDDQFKIAKKYAKGNVIESLDNAFKNKGNFKGLFYAKLGAALALTAASYLTLTKIRHHYTHKSSEAEFYKEQNARKISQELIQKQSTLKFTSLQEKNKNGNNISFGMTGKGLESFLFDPAKNSMLFDLFVIIPGRVGTGRNFEKYEFGFKEACALTFLYLAGPKIQTGMEWLSRKFLKTPMELDARVLDSPEFIEMFNKKGKVHGDLNAFRNLKSETEILEFIHNNPKNILVKAAKISDTIATLEDGKTINVKKYIDIKNVEKIADNIQDLYNAAKSSTSKKTLAGFIKNARNYKIASIIANIAICCAGLGYVMPKMLYGIRKYFKGSTEFHVKKDIKAKLEAQSSKAA